jgi:hypothetical protein
MAVVVSGGVVSRVAAVMVRPLAPAATSSTRAPGPSSAISSIVSVAWPCHSSTVGPQPVPRLLRGGLPLLPDLLNQGFLILFENITEEHAVGRIEEVAPILGSQDSLPALPRSALEDRDADPG